MQRSMILTGSFPSSRSFFVASADESLNPLQIMFMSALSESVRFSSNLGTPLRAGLSALSLFAPFLSPFGTPVGGAPIPNALNKIP